MANHVINDITSYYAHEDDAMERRNEIKSVVEEYSHQRFYVYWILHIKKNFMILHEPHKGKYMIEVPSQKEYNVIEHLKKILFSKSC